jgi:hypothetical protein
MALPKVRYSLQWESKNLIAVSTAIQDWLTSSRFGIWISVTSELLLLHTPSVT